MRDFLTACKNVFCWYGFYTELFQELDGTEESLASVKPVSYLPVKLRFFGVGSGRVSVVEELAVVCGMVGWGEELGLIYPSSCSEQDHEYHLFASCGFVYWVLKPLRTKFITSEYGIKPPYLLLFLMSSLNLPSCYLWYWEEFVSIGFVMHFQLQLLLDHPLAGFLLD